MNREISIFKNPAIIGYLIKKMSEVYHGKQIGKTIVQKLIFLLVEKKVFYFRYSMFHYGPFSSEVAGELDYAGNLDIVDITWKYNEGYFIFPTKNIDHFEYLLTENEKKQIDQVVKNYGALSAVELSILATSIFLKTHFNTPEKALPQVVHNIKPKYTLEFIENIIKNHIHKSKSVDH
jgi:uncharacterized protein YwgA